MPAPRHERSAATRLRGLRCGVRGAAVAAVAFGFVVHSALGASAAWAGAGTGNGSAGAATVSTPNAPNVSRSRSSAVITWSASALTSGQAAGGYTVLRHAGTTTTVCTTTAPTLTCTDPNPVTGTQTYGVVASFGGWSSQESPQTSFSNDTTAPTTSASATGSPNGSGWISAASSTVTVSATDTESGVASTSYRTNAGSWVTVNGSSNSFNVNAQGTTTVDYFATDNAGNGATTKTLTVKLDNVAPAVSMTYPPSGTLTSVSWNGHCRNSSNVVSNGLCGGSTDSTSGVASVSYELRRTPLLGGVTVCWNSNSQNWTSAVCGNYRAAAQGPSGIASWYVPLSASNLGTGNFELRIRATDQAGNVSTETSPTQTFSVLL